MNEVKESRIRRLPKQLLGVVLLAVLCVVTWICAPFIWIGAALVALWRHAGGGQTLREGFDRGQDAAGNTFSRVLSRGVLHALLFCISSLTGLLLGLIGFPLVFLTGRAGQGLGRLRDYAMSLARPAEPQLILADVGSGSVVPDTLMGAPVTRQPRPRAQRPRATKPAE